MTRNQTKALIKQELRSTMRSRFAIIDFILLPLLLWGAESGIQLILIYPIGIMTALIINM